MSGRGAREGTLVRMWTVQEHTRAAQRRARGVRASTFVQKVERRKGGDTRRLADQVHDTQAHTRDTDKMECASTADGTSMVKEQSRDY